MEYENTNESAKQDTNISREEAVKKVKELYELIKKIKIKYYCKKDGLPEHEKNVVKQLQVQMSKTASEHSLKELYILLEKSSRSYDNPSNILNNGQLSEEELRELYNSAVEAQVAALKIGNLTRASGCQEIANKIKGMQDPYTQKICLQEQRKFFENGLRSLQADKEMLNSIYKENSNAGTGYEKEEFAKLISKKSRQTELVEPMYKKDMAEPEAQEI